MRHALMSGLGLCAATSMAMAGGGREIAVTYRDFTGIGTTAEGSNPPSDHPDFENEDAYCWNVVNQAPPAIGGLGIGVIPELGIVGTSLGGDGKPQYVGGDMATTTGASNFASWFNDDATYNTTASGSLLLADNGDGTFT